MIHDRTCPECGKAFTPTNGSQVCCSDECKASRKKMLDADRKRFCDRKSENAFREARREKARRRAEFFAARDAIAPKPRTEIIYNGGVIIERRGFIPAGVGALRRVCC